MTTPASPSMIEITNGNPVEFIHRVRELIHTPHGFAMGLRYTGPSSSTPTERILIEILLDPAKPNIPIRWIDAKQGHHREAASRDSLPLLVASILGGEAPTPAPAARPTPTALPTPPAQPAKHKKPTTKVGDTFTLF